MTPSRTRKPVTSTRPTSEVVLAALAAAGVVLGTALLVWLLRPGPPGSFGTGGLAARQPRAALLVALTIAAVGLTVWWILRRRRAGRVSNRAALIGTVAVMLVGAVVAGFVWPGGLLRKYETFEVPDFTETPDITEPPDVTESTAPAPTPAPPTTAAPTPTTSPG
jgi:hypothetical protein